MSVATYSLVSFLFSMCVGATGLTMATSTQYPRPVGYSILKSLTRFESSGGSPALSSSLDCSTCAKIRRVNSGVIFFMRRTRCLAAQPETTRSVVNIRYYFFEIKHLR